QNEDELALTLRRTALRDEGLDLVAERESNGERQHGFSLSLSAPLFDNGDTELSLMQGNIQHQRIQQQQIESEATMGIKTSLQETQSILQQLSFLESTELHRFRRMMDFSLADYNFMLRRIFELLTFTDLTLDA